MCGVFTLVVFVPGLVCRFLCLSLEADTAPVLSAGADSCLPALLQTENFQLYTKAKLLAKRTFHRGLLGKIHGWWLSRSGKWW